MTLTRTLLVTTVTMVITVSEDAGASQFTNIPKHHYHDDDVMMLMMMMVIVMEIMMRSMILVMKISMIYIISLTIACPSPPCVLIFIFSLCSAQCNQQ